MRLNLLNFAELNYIIIEKMLIFKLYQIFCEKTKESDEYKFVYH